MRSFTVSKISRISEAFENHFLEAHSLPPLFFQHRKNSKIVLEIGFGNGELITRMAAKRKKDMFIGIESSEISCEKAVKRAYDMGLKNVKFMRGDGKFLVREFFKDESVDVVLVFYPIPWPKKSDAKKRLLNVEILKTILTILKENGKFVLVTDDKPYLEWVLKNLESLQTEFSTHELIPIRSTKYGRKWEKLGRKSWSITVKAKKFDVKRIVEGKELPHFHLKNIEKKNLQERLLELSSKTFKENGITIEFKGMFQNESEYVLRTVGVDGNFAQTYYILVKHRNGEWLVRLDDIAKVFKTPAVKKSVEYVAKFLSSQVEEVDKKR